MKRSTSVGIAMSGLLAIAGTAQAGQTIVYTLYAESNSVAGVLLNGTALTGQIEFRFRSDTSNVRQVQENGVYVWRIDTGNAMFTISQGSQRTVARILPNQVYVRYDPANGVIGFGSYAAGNYYPMSLNCQGYSCDGFEGGIVGALAD